MPPIVACLEDLGVWNDVDGKHMHENSKWCYFHNQTNCPHAYIAVWVQPIEQLAFPKITLIPTPPNSAGRLVLAPSTHCCDSAVDAWLTTFLVKNGLQAHSMIIRRLNGSNHCNPVCNDYACCEVSSPHSPVLYMMLLLEGTDSEYTASDFT